MKLFNTESINKKDYKIIVEKSLIIEYYNGKFNVEELIKFKELIGNNNDYNPNFNVIHDFRDADFLFDLDVISKYVKLISEDRKYLGPRKSTMITKTPNQVVTSIGFEMQKNNLPISVNVCSTIKSALKFVELPTKDWHLIGPIIENFKN